MEQTTKLGDIVLYSETEETKKAAIVTRVYEDGETVDLTVFHPASMDGDAAHQMEYVVYDPKAERPGTYKLRK